MGEPTVIRPAGGPDALTFPARLVSSLPAGGRGASEALTLRGMAHDARNLVTALRLCSELIAEPGVLGQEHQHFAEEIRSIARASEQLVRRLSSFSHNEARKEENLPVVEEPITDLPAAVRRLSGLLSAVTGPLLGIEIACLPCRGQLRLSDENLTRILLNLVRNAGDAMPMGGHIRITVQRGGGASFFWALTGEESEEETDLLWGDGPGGEEQGAPTALLAVEDDGPGIPREFLDRVFEPGFSTRRDHRPWPQSPHHGLGLSIVRELVEKAGGTVRAVLPPRQGTRIEIELPLTNVTPCLPSEPVPNEGRTS